MPSARITEKLQLWITLGGIGAVLGALVLLFVAVFGDLDLFLARLLLALAAPICALLGVGTLLVSSWGTRWHRLSAIEKAMVLPGVVVGWPGLVLFALFLMAVLLKDSNAGDFTARREEGGRPWRGLNALAVMGGGSVFALFIGGLYVVGMVSWNHDIDRETRINAIRARIVAYVDQQGSSPVPLEELERVGAVGEDDRAFLAQNGLRYRPIARGAPPDEIVFVNQQADLERYYYKNGAVGYLRSWPSPGGVTGLSTLRPDRTRTRVASALPIGRAPILESLRSRAMPATFSGTRAASSWR